MEKLVSGRLVDGSRAHSRTPPNILEVPGRSPNLHCSAPAMGWLGGVLPHHALRRRPFGGCEIVGANSTCSRRWTRVLFDWRALGKQWGRNRGLGRAVRKNRPQAAAGAADAGLRQTAWSARRGAGCSIGDQFGLKAMKSRLRCSLRPRRSELATPRTLIKTCYLSCCLQSTVDVSRSEGIRILRMNIPPRRAYDRSP